ncbi:MAG: MATE family efflux transporter [Sphaerochaetaceae bacterium]|jgi:putative MATE family efflux protein
MNNSLTDGSRSPGLTIWMLAWPIILDQTFNTMMQYIDSAMVGSLGAVATAAVGVNSSTIWLVNGIIYAFALAFGVLSARQIGSQDTKGVHHTVRQSLLAILALSVVVTTLMRSIAHSLPKWIGVEPSVAPQAGTYMAIIASAYPFSILFSFMANLIRSSGDTRSPLITNIIASVANIIGNTLLIYPTRQIHLWGKTTTLWGANLGVKGAALATAMATALSALILFSVFLAKSSPLRTPWRNVSWKVDWSTMKQIAVLGTPLALERATLNVGQVVLTMLVTRIGTIALAAHHLAITAESITYMPVSGFSMAATTLVAHSLGASNKDLARTFAQKSLRSGVLMMSVAGLFLYVFAPNLLGMLTKDQQVVVLGAKVLRIEAFAQPFFALSIVGSGILRGAGDTKWPFINSVIGMWGVRLLPASILILGFNKGLEAAWMCMVADLIIRGALNWRRYRIGSWVDAWRS